MVKLPGRDAYNTTKALTVISEGSTGIKEGKSGNLPHSFELSQNYPNPFNPSTNAVVKIKSTTDANLKIYNAIGQEVATVFSGTLEAGDHKFNWNAGNLPSGNYFMKLETPEGSQTKKMMLLK
jgi:flagellar hook assembly protein FlgD